ncbi:MAG: sulfatase [Planctomycetota bacterium]
MPAEDSARSTLKSAISAGALWGIGAEGLLRIVAALASNEIVPTRLSRLGSLTRVGGTLALVLLVLHAATRLLPARFRPSTCFFSLTAALSCLWLAVVFGPLGPEFRTELVTTPDYFRLRIPVAAVSTAACLASLVFGLRLLRNKSTGHLVPAALLAAGVSCLLPGATTRPAGGTLPDLLMLTVDTLRADHMGCYGYPAALDTTPRLDEFAKETTRFEHAFTAVPRTGPSYSTLFTATYPQVHGVMSNLVQLPEDVRTVQERLGERGYHTIALVKGAWPSTFINLDQGWDYVFHRGFPIFRPFRTIEDGLFSIWYAARSFLEERYRLPSSAFTDAAVRFVADRPDAGPALYHICWNEPHDPYVPPDRFLRPAPVGPETTIALYDAEIRFFDAQIGRVIDTVRETGLLGRSWTFFMSDHGEELNRMYQGRAWWGHGHLVFDASVHIPLLVRPPDARAAEFKPGTVSTVVENIDIGATLLDLGGADREATAGESLVPLLAGGTRENARAFSISSPYSKIEELRYTIRTGNWRYVETWMRKRRMHRQLYRHDGTDPGETRDVIEQHPDVAHRLELALKAWMDG